MAPCKAVFIIEWITMDKKVKMKMKCTLSLKEPLKPSFDSGGHLEKQ